MLAKCQSSFFIMRLTKHIISMHDEGISCKPSEVLGLTGKSPSRAGFSKEYGESDLLWEKLKFCMNEGSKCQNAPSGVK